MKEFITEYNVYISTAAAVFTMTTMIIALITFFTRGKRPCKLYYKPSEAINIFNSLSNGFKKFDIRYDGHPITNNLIYITGSLISKGKDIESTDNVIRIQAPYNCTWVTVSIEKKEYIKADARVDENNNQEMILSFGKLRHNNSISINAILQTEKKFSSIDLKDIQYLLGFIHSIDKTDDVKIRNSFFFIYILPALIGIFFSVFGIMVYEGFKYNNLTLLNFVLAITFGIILLFYLVNLLKVIIKNFMK